MSEHVLRDGTDDDLISCVDLWVRACAERDGGVRAGVAERARRKFAHAVAWRVAGTAERTEGFVLATDRGSGAADDPSDAAVLGLLAVDPEVQGSGLGRRLLRAATSELQRLGFERVILHVLTDNAAAVRLYESEGWHPLGEPFDHGLLHRESQAYTRDLSGSARRRIAHPSQARRAAAARGSGRAR